MSRWLDLANSALEKIETLPDNRLKAAISPIRSVADPLLPVSAGCRVEDSNSYDPHNPGLQSADISTLPGTDEVSTYGKTRSGSPRTWTGKVVSLAEWRSLSEWERHGSTGLMWNGLAQQWEHKP